MTRLITCDKCGKSGPLMSDFERSYLNKSQEPFDVCQSCSERLRDMKDKAVKEWLEK